jgi:hypothetical protein
MEIPKDKILDLLRQQGKSDQAEQANQELPDKVDPERLDLHLTELQETLVLVKGRRRRRHRTPPRPRRARTHHTRARNTITGGV